MRPSFVPTSPAAALLLAALTVTPAVAANPASPPDRPDAPAAAAEEPGPPTGPQSIERVAEFYVQDGALGVRTSLRPTGGLTTVDVPDLPGTVNVDVTLRSRRDRPDGLMFFKLMHSTEAGGGEAATTVDTTVLVRPGYFQLNRVTRAGDDLRTVVLNQSGDFGKAAAPPADRDDRVTLRVRRLRLPTSDLLEDVTRTAPTFVELLRRYPRDAAEHLAPIFRDFKQEATVFGADTRVAWQVLSDLLPRDPRLVPRVRALVARLDAGDFRTREDAAKQLRELGGPAALVLSDLPRGGYSVEQNSQIDTILSEFRPLPPQEAKQRLNDPQFLLNCLAYGEDATIRAAAAARIGELTGKPVPPPPEDREQRAKLVRELREGLEDGPSKASGWDESAR